MKGSAGTNLLTLHTSLTDRTSGFACIRARRSLIDPRDRDLTARTVTHAAPVRSDTAASLFVLREGRR